MHDLTLYSTNDGKLALPLSASACLTLLEIAERLACSKQNHSQHIRNILAAGEQSGSALKASLPTASDGKQHRTPLDNLDSPLAVRYP